MCNKNDFLDNYWNYYLLLEEEYIEIEKIIPVDDINNKTFSNKYMKILFSLCSEIDVLFKIFIEFNNWANFYNTDGNMGKYKEIITKNIPYFTNEILSFSGIKELKPFDNWNFDKKLTWWDDYNLIKHKRTLTTDDNENYKKANQENILNALCALYQLEMYYYKSIIDKNNDKDKLRIPVPQSKRIRIKEWKDNVALINNRYILYIKETGDLILEGSVD